MLEVLLITLLEQLSMLGLEADWQNLMVIKRQSLTTEAYQFYPQSLPS